MAIKSKRGQIVRQKKDSYIMKILFLLLMLLWNKKEGAHATQGKETYCVDMPSLLIVVVNGNI